MSYTIEKRIIPGLPNISLTAIRYVVAHEAGNPDNTGPNSLENEINFMTRNFRNAFTSHWVGSGGRIVQLAPVGRLQYGAGPRANPYSYAHVELARTSDPATFKKDYAAYVWLLRHLAGQAGIPKTLDAGGSLTKGIKTHEWISKNVGGTTHTDPYAYLAQFGITRAQFKKDVENGLQVVKPAAPAPKKEEIVLFNSGSATLNKEFVDMIVKARKQGILSSDTYVDKAKKGTLTLQEAVAINGIIAKRAYLDKAK